MIDTGLGRAPPKVITIEYDPDDVDTFIEIADAIEEAFPKVIVNGNDQGPGRPGAFEVRAPMLYLCECCDDADVPNIEVQS